MARNITADEAASIVHILVEECGYIETGHSIGEMARAIEWPNANSRYPCTEYRFMGALGFGGKFRNNGNRDGVPHVDCYRENQSPQRLEMIEKANARLAQMFAPASI